ncbi:hypothetical protein PRIPAC_80125 [Pristionchus pacificus]|uniref:Fizzy-related protein homolog n=1 Tax=Pristionchus pacificus TaxID=54126 RepID=A0A2A6C3A6_PRIPA|nr:hypothetical protein PRIPAC_80125 [Pristionchus pacificus]|eukprot:PDM72654.1 WD40 domain-containing protein [Pristionchus pacificus]
MLKVIVAVLKTVRLLNSFGYDSMFLVNYLNRSLTDPHYPLFEFIYGIELILLFLAPILSVRLRTCLPIVQVVINSITRIIIIYHEYFGPEENVDPSYLIVCSLIREQFLAYITALVGVMAADRWAATIKWRWHGDASTSSPSIFSGHLSEDSQRLLKSPRKPQRKVPKNPYKVLDAPELQDDFYLNLVDWSSQNMLSVGLNQCVYLWSACNSQVIKLCDLANDSDSVTSVQWTDKGDFLAVGTNKGITQIWAVHANKMVHEMPGHSSRIGCLAWNGDIICSGSRDRVIIQRDVRAPPGYSERRLTSHRQEVCGLKWSPDKQYLASGGNDNQLLVWSLRRPEPCQTYTEHNAAVKALAWSPHHHGLLVSGGGTADRCLRFLNTLTGQPMQCIDTGSQVCNVAWSKHSPELVSTHGYSYNQVVIWKYPSLQPVTKLAGHQTRVLYLAMSPDGESIVTGAGDETLRFWHVFCKSGVPKTARSRLNLIQSLR